EGGSGAAQYAYSGLFGHVGERSVAVVVVQRITAVIGDVEVLPPVTVIVGCGHSHAEPSACDSCFIGHVGERAVVVVVVKGVLERRGRRVEITGAAVDQVDVHPAVVVIVEEGASRAHGLRQVVSHRVSVVVRPGNAARLGGHFFE